jgi:di/tricarboxylate transporter
VLAASFGDGIRRTGFQDEPLEPGSTLVLIGKSDRLEALKENPDFDTVHEAPFDKLSETYKLEERLLVMEVPLDTAFVGKTIANIRLGEAVGMQILAIIRRGKIIHLPGPEDDVTFGDQLILQGRLENLELLKALQGLKPVEGGDRTKLPNLESENVGFVEAVLSPDTTLVGKTLRQLRFRNKYNLTVLSIRRKGKTIQEALSDVPLQFGDALLLYGKRSKFSLLGMDPDFLVLTEAAQDVPRTEKLGLSLAIFMLSLLSVVLGFLPIYIAAIIGSGFMVITKCLTMDEAYRCIEWKAVFLIAGMLPLGVALDSTGAARFLAEGVVSLVGPYGPLAIMGGIVGLTFLATCFVPTAALVVIMAPIALKTSADMGMAPHALMMAVAIAASASFMTPVSHPANILVMGPGGYRFIDYIKIGLPLTIVVFLAIMIGVPLFWPM